MQGCLITVEDVIPLKELPVDFSLLEQLSKKGKIILERDKIKFQNFCGYLDKKQTLLVVPRKLIHLLGLEGKEFKLQREIFNHFFEHFLWKVLTELSDVGIFYTLSTIRFPVEEHRFGGGLLYRILLLLEKERKLESYLSYVIAAPHRELIKKEENKPPWEVEDLDPSGIADTLTSPRRWVNFKNLSLPLEMVHYRYTETYNTVENRFVKHLLMEILETLDTFGKKLNFLIPDLERLKENLRWFLQSDFLRAVGRLKTIPYHSKVLQRKAGYRELFIFWRLLHSNFVPIIFSRLDMAFALKDMATLWEYYSLAKLLKALRSLWGPFEVEIWKEKTRKFGDKETFYEEAVFSFPQGVRLRYQPTLRSYSQLEMRPDFVVEVENRRLIFDAKFRILKGSTRREVILNMHYYRDALKAELCVALSFSPQQESVLFTTEGTKVSDKTLEEIFKFQKFQGVGSHSNR